jgi:hypothetical protein
MPTRKEVRSKDYSPKLNVEHDKKELRSNNYCTHCNMSGHWIERCWKLHPQLRIKMGKKIVHSLMKKGVADERVGQAPKIQEEKPKKENPLANFGKKWVTHIQDCLLPLL